MLNLTVNTAFTITFLIMIENELVHHIKFLISNLSTWAFTNTSEHFQNALHSFACHSVYCE